MIGVTSDLNAGIKPILSLVGIKPGEHGETSVSQDMLSH